MNSGVFWVMLSAHIQPDPSELNGQRHKVQMDNDPQHTAKATEDLFKASGTFCNGQVNHLTRIQLNIHFTHKTEGKMPQE